MCVFNCVCVLIWCFGVGKLMWIVRIRLVCMFWSCGCGFSVVSIYVLSVSKEGTARSVWACGCACVWVAWFVLLSVIIGRVRVYGAGQVCARESSKMVVCV